jgi:Kef-type K+ transport system membrane component KefB
MHFLLDLAILLIAARALGEFAERLKFPPLIGYIIAGMILGPLLGFVEQSNIAPFGRLGLILLLFVAGFKEVDLERLLKEKNAGLLTGTLASVIPFLIAYFLGRYFGYSLGVSLFLGLILAATSISISLGAFIELGRLDSKLGRSILSASIVDDILGLVGLAIISSIVVAGGMPGLFGWGKLLLGLILFVGVIVFGGVFAPAIMKLTRRLRSEEIQFSVVLIIVILLAYIAEIVGLSTVLGAFLAGVILSRVPMLETRSFSDKLHVVSEGMFIPLFFAWVGLGLSIVPAALFSWITLFIIIIAIVSKFVGGALSGLILKMKIKEATSLGIGMIPRGEVTLVVLMVASELIPDFPPVIFSAILILIAVTTIIAPLLLKLTLGEKS